MEDGFGARKIVGYWMVGTSGLVAGIVVLGGLTRLTQSGLSMVDWKLIHFRPPTNLEWEECFEKYKNSPEYQINNHGMNLDEFKRIYWMEHAHRVYGRLLGLWIIVPTIYFFSSKHIYSNRIKASLLASSGLVIFQVSFGIILAHFRDFSVGTWSKADSTLK
jgi:heme a synthase